MAQRYHNPRTGVEVNIDDLSMSKAAFFAEAMRRFRANADWFAFDDFVFGWHSALYAAKRAHTKVLRSPLYLALRDMSLQLAVQQGRITAA